MNWEAIGAVGEVVGAVAVVATLVYLATQIRQNTRSNQTAAIQTISSQNAEWLSLLSGPDGSAKLVYFDAQPGLSGLTDDDLARYFSVMIHMGRLYDTQYLLYRMEAVPDELWDSSLRSLATIMESKGAREWWKLSRHLFTTSFRDLVDDVVARQGSD